MQVDADKRVRGVSRGKWMVAAARERLRGRGADAGEREGGRWMDAAEGAR